MVKVERLHKQTRTHTVLDIKVICLDVKHRNVYTHTNFIGHFYAHQVILRSTKTNQNYVALLITMNINAILIEKRE